MLVSFIFLITAFNMQAYAQTYSNKLDQNTMNETVYDVKTKNGETFRIFEAVPNKPAPQAGWPILYLLDGNTTFPLATIQKPDTILIGIGYPTDNKDEIVQRRYYDLTTKTNPDDIPLKAGMDVPKTGGEGNFRDFILNELIPDINHRLPTQPKQATLFGHSLGGIFALRTLIKTPNNFHTVCAIDPSIWWNKHAFLNDVKAIENINTMSRLLIETAGKKANKPNISSESAEKLKAIRGGPNGRDVANILAAHKKITVLYRNFDNETHGSIIKPALDDCLSVILNHNNSHIKTLSQEKKP